MLRRRKLPMFAGARRPPPVRRGDQRPAGVHDGASAHRQPQANQQDETCGHCGLQVKSGSVSFASDAGRMVVRHPNALQNIAHRRLASTRRPFP